LATTERELAVRGNKVPTVVPRSFTPLGYVGLARRPSDETVGADFRDTGTINFVGSDFLR
jgi:hypothetical protein